MSWKRDRNARIVIYALVDEREPERVRYVGQTQNPAQRYRHHRCYDGGYHAPPVRQWAGRVPRLWMKLLGVCEGAYADHTERLWIDRLQSVGQADLNVIGASYRRLLVGEMLVRDLDSKRAG